MCEAVAAIVAERRDMATSLRDTDSIVSSLEAFLAGVTHLLFIAFYLLVWQINVMSGFSTFSATVLALTCECVEFVGLVEGGGGSARG